MSDDNWPWYTEWNGIFMPVQDAVGMGCAMAIVMVILSLLGYLVFLLIKLVVEGFKALGRKELGKAFVYWAIPGAIVFGLFSTMVAGAASVAAQEVRREQALDSIKSALEEGNYGEVLTVNEAVAVGKGDTWHYEVDFRVEPIPDSREGTVEYQGVFCDRGTDYWTFFPGSQSSIYCISAPGAHLQKPCLLFRVPVELRFGEKEELSWTWCWNK